MALWWTHYGDGAPISIITSISISLTAAAAKCAPGGGAEWWASAPPSMTNTDRCTLGWAIIWTCIKTIYKQCNWPGSGGDAAQKWTGWQIFVPHQHKRGGGREEGARREGFINFWEAVIEFLRGLSCSVAPTVQGSSPAVTLHTSNTEKSVCPPPSPSPAAVHR